MEANSRTNSDVSRPIFVGCSRQRSKSGLKKYKYFLVAIAIQLGLEEKDAELIAESVYIDAEKNRICCPSNLAFKIYLAKAMVHDCIFRLSSVMFCKGNGDFIYAHGKPDIPKVVLCMPPSVRVVYLLHKSDEFSEKELAEILNIPLMTVKDRLARAASTLKKM